MPSQLVILLAEVQSEGIFNSARENCRSLLDELHDNRLKYPLSPYFLSGIGSDWKRLKFVEIFNPAAARLSSVF